MPFAVRGRLEDASSLRWRTEPEGGPIGAAALEEAMATAAAAWSAAGGGRVRFERATPADRADVLVSWRRAEDDPCRLFGRGRSVAHTGPLAGGSFIHLDAGQAWSAAGESLEVALAHELGHVLGLDHSPDPDALMSSDTRTGEPSAADAAGLFSLYGGGADGPGDVLIEDAETGRREAPALRRIAPPARTALALFDVDGDGDDELLVWRTDARGYGALVIHDFARSPGGGPVLARTVGPMLELVPRHASTALRRGAGGRWLLTREEGELRLRRFDERGILRAPEPREQIALDLEALLAEPAPAVIAATSPSGSPAHGTDGRPAGELLGDLDGDGRIERVRRLGASATGPP